MAVFDAFISATTWHEFAFLKTGSDEVWRVWFNYSGELNMEMLTPDQRKYEYPEAIAALNGQTRLTYDKDKQTIMAGGRPLGIKIDDTDLA
jgi:hypothetical protein